MGQKKLIKFEAIKKFENVLEYPAGMAGNWNAYFNQLNNGNNSNEAPAIKPLVLELACGRGEYAVGLAREHSHQNFLGLDIKGNRIWKGASIAIQEGLKNVAFLRTQIENCVDYFSKDEVSEIWITFPDPQLRISKAKKRLTHPQFLRCYQTFLRQGGLVNLKTDSPNLFLFTKTVIELYGLTLIVATDDLYGNEFRNSNKWDERYAIKTYYEGLNIASSNRIYYIQFKIDKVLPIEKDEKLKEIIASFEVTETHDAKRVRNSKSH